MSENQRPMTLVEYVDQLEKTHPARNELNILFDCRNEPGKWFLWDLKRKLLPFIDWAAPITPKKIEFID